MGTSANRHYTVYIHTSPSGKRYVGITGQSTAKRWRPDQYLTCKAFYAAISKYGWDNITSRIVSVGLTKEEAKRAERFLIAKYKTTDSNYGYNILSGGNISDGTTPEIREKIAMAHRGKKRSDETKKRLRESLERAGVTCQVVCYETGISYRSQADAEKELGLSRGGISRALDNSLWTCGGYHWVTTLDGASPPQKTYFEQSRRPVMIIETRQVFESVTALAEFLNSRKANVVNACMGRNRTVSGVHVKYVGDDDPDYIGAGRYENVRKPVVNITTGEIYESVQQASNKLNIKTEQIIAVCKGRTYSTHGMRFAYASSKSLSGEACGENRKTRKSNTGKSLPVQCVETGVIYSSMNHTSKETGIDRKNIARVCNCETATAGKLHWITLTI